MAFFGLFKKKESFMDKGPNLDMGSGFRDETGLGPPSFQNQAQPFQAQNQQNIPLGGFESSGASASSASPNAFGEMKQNNNAMQGSKDSELILAKLDTIKAILENLSQRIQNLESKQQEKKYW